MFKRLRNLWRLSESEPMRPEDNNNLPVGTKLSRLISKPDNKVEIIKKKEDPISKIVNQ